MKLSRMVIVIGLAGMSLMAFGTGMASGAALCKTNANTEACPEPYFAGQTLEASLGGSAILEWGETVLDTCTATTLKGKVANAGSSTEAAKANIEELAWGGCTKTTDTVSVKGSLEFAWIEGTDNATLKASGTEWTINTIFGSCIYGFGTSTDLGTLTGGSPATISINTIVTRISGSEACQKETRWTAQYTFTEPTPLYFASRANSSVLCKTNANTEACPEPYSTGQALEASLKKESSAVLESLTGTILDTCTGTTLKAKTTNTGSASEAVKASVEELAWSGCTKTTTTTAKGSLEFDWIEGTDNATLTASGTEWTINSVFGTCSYGYGSVTDLGSLIGGNPASLSINVIVSKTAGSGLCAPETRWKAEYTFTEPAPLYFTAG